MMRTAVRLVLAVTAVATGIAVALTHPALTGWTILAALLIVTGFALLIEVTHPHVDEASECLPELVWNPGDSLVLPPDHTHTAEPDRG